MAQNVEAGNPKQISASTLVRTGAGTVIGIFCSNAGATSKVALCDAVASVASAGAGRFVSPFVPAVGILHQVRAGFGTGLYVSLSGSAQNITVIYKPQS